MHHPKSTQRYKSTPQNTLLHIKKQLATRQRYIIKPTPESHKFLVGTSKAAIITPKPIGTSCLGTCKINNNNKISQEEKQMLGHLAEQSDPSAPPLPLPRQSAVVVPLCSNNGVPSLLFMKRASKYGSHRGQVAFPGGMFDPEDNNDPYRCALREMTEEIGLTQNDVDIIGLHHDAGTSDKSRNISTGVVKSTIITPVIINIHQDLQQIGDKIRLSGDELEYCFTVPIHDLLDDQRWIPYKGRPSYTHHHDINNLFPLDYNVTNNNQQQEQQQHNNNNLFKYVLTDDGIDLTPEQLHQQQQHNVMIQSSSSSSSSSLLSSSSSSIQQPKMNNNTNLDQLSIAQLQYLALTQQDDTDSDDIYGINHKNDNIRQVIVPKDELIWGATAHITSLFIKQVIAPISDDLFEVKI